MPVQKPAAPGKRPCGMCGKPLSQYNKDDICMSHNPDDVLKFRNRQEGQDKESRAVLSFMKELHQVGTVKEFFDKVKKDELSEVKRKAVTDLEKYPEALGLLKVASRIFRLSMPRILRKSTESKPKLVRDILAYIMRKDLEMSPEDVALFFGYQYLPRVPEAVERITYAMLEDEDLILAVDLVRDEFKYTDAE